MQYNKKQFDINMLTQNSIRQKQWYCRNFIFQLSQISDEPYLLLDERWSLNIPKMYGQVGLTRLEVASIIHCWNESCKIISFDANIN